MKLFLVFVSLAITAFSYSVADLPPYCGVDIEEYPKAEGTLRQVHLVTRYQIMFLNCLSLGLSQLVVYDLEISPQCLNALSFRF
jgi:hypothetical protein